MSSSSSASASLPSPLAAGEGALATGLFSSAKDAAPSLGSGSSASDRWQRLGGAQGQRAEEEKKHIHEDMKQGNREKLVPALGDSMGFMRRSVNPLRGAWNFERG